MKLKHRPKYLKIKLPSTEFWLFFLPRAILVLLVIFALLWAFPRVRHFGSAFLRGFRSGLSQATPRPSSGQVPPGPAPTVPPDQLGAVSGSHTEMFTVTPDKLGAKSTAYLDTKTMTLSFPPKFDWEQVASLNPLAGEQLAAAGGNGREVLILTQRGLVWAFGSDLSYLSPVSLLQPLLTKEGSGEVPNGSKNLTPPLLGKERSADQPLLSKEGSGEVPNGSKNLTPPLLGKERSADQPLLSKEGSGEVRSSKLAYDSDSGLWSVAFISANTVHLAVLSVDAQSARVVSSQTLSDPGNAQIGDLACVRGECLLLLTLPLNTEQYRPATALYRFSPRNLAETTRLPLREQLSGAEHVSLGQTPDAWLVGVVRRVADQPSPGNLGGRPIRYQGTVFSIRANSSSGNSGKDFSNGANLFLSPYRGGIRFGYDPGSSPSPFPRGGEVGSGSILAVYVAYFGQAATLTVNSRLSTINRTEDYSRFFPQRVVGGQAEGESDLALQIFGQDGRWWAGSDPSSPSLKLLRVLGGVGTDLTEQLLANIRTSQLVPGFKTDSVFAVLEDGSGIRVQQLIDHGFDTSGPAVWESERLNQWNGKIVQGTVLETKDSGRENFQFPISNIQRPTAEPASAQNSGVAKEVRYSLSADGGKHWFGVEVGRAVGFNNQSSIIDDHSAASPSDDFRFRVELLPSADLARSPWASSVRVEYWIVRIKK
ncbi:MAG: hypothetical protein HY978_00880 [Candidatus Liptonbacteria bacterium]|nr:hypothetical protein [Candidatus Liptonbacteria bacterium]